MPAPECTTLSAFSVTVALPLPSLTMVIAPFRTTSTLATHAAPAISVTENVIVKLPAKFCVNVAPPAPPVSAPTTAP